MEISDQDASDEPTVDDLDAIVEHDREIGYSQYANVRNIVGSLSFTFSVFTLSSFILISYYSLLIIDHKNAARFPAIELCYKKKVWQILKVRVLRSSGYGVLWLWFLIGQLL